MSSQMMAISDLGETLMTRGLDAKEIFTLDYIHEFAIDLNKLQNILKIEISAVQQ